MKNKILSVLIILGMFTLMSSSCENTTKPTSDKQAQITKPLYGFFL